MKLLHHVFLIPALLLSNLAYADQIAAENKFALIYNGISTCDGCPQALADVAKMAHLPVKFVSNPEDVPHLLNQAAIFIIGGTEDNIEPMREAFNKDIVTAIKDYLEHGGKYLGICGGAFIAAKNYYADESVRVNGFGIIPATAVDYSKTDKPHLENIKWHNKNVVLYFQGGPEFKLDKNAKDINIIAKYQNGAIAAFESSYGEGRVIVVGPHPEADKTWLEADHINAPQWQPKQNLAVELLNNKRN